jgi:hypothetical protein
VAKHKGNSKKGQIKASNIGGLYTKNTEISRLAKRKQVLNERLKKTADRDEIQEINAKLQSIEARLKTKNKYWSSVVKKTPDEKPGAVVSIPVEEYLNEKSTDDTLLDDYSIDRHRGADSPLEIIDDSNDVAPFSFQEIDDLILSGDDEALLELWTDRFNRIGDRESAAKVFARVRFVQGIDKIQKNFADYIGHELVTVFPLEDLPISNTSPTGTEIKHDKKKALISQTLREGQASFRAKLIKHYGSRCMVTGETIDSIIEAAHIIPYCGPDSNRVENGLLLRVDIHRLFDQGLLTIHPHTRKICVNVSLNKTSYLIFNDKELILESKFLARDDYLEYRWKTFLEE